MRISRTDMLLDVAAIVARRGTCLRLTVGAVIARDGRIISSGYNGAPHGLPHCTVDTCNPLNPCSNATHAESNAITYAARGGVATLGAELYATDSPCIECARVIINAGIVAVHYRREYRITDGLGLLVKAGVYCSHHQPGNRYGD